MACQGLTARTAPRPLSPRSIAKPRGTARCQAPHGNPKAMTGPRGGRFRPAKALRPTPLRPNRPEVWPPPITYPPKCVGRRLRYMKRTNRLLRPCRCLERAAAVAELHPQHPAVGTVEDASDLAVDRDPARLPPSAEPVEGDHPRAGVDHLLELEPELLPRLEPAPPGRERAVGPPVGARVGERGHAEDGLEAVVEEVGAGGPLPPLPVGEEPSHRL